MEQTKEIQVLDGWHEVTIGQYQEIAALNDLDATDRMIEIVSILTDEDPELIRKMKITSLTKIIQHLSWTNSVPDDANYKPVITINGIEYGFISRLTDLTNGDWIDLEHYLMEPNINMHNIFATLYRPLVIAMNDRDRILETDTTNSFEERALLFKDKAIIADVYGAFVFFSIIVNESMMTIQEYLADQIVEMEMTNLKTKMPKLKRSVWQMSYKMRKLLKVICGLGSYTTWQKETLQKWRAFLKRTLS